jgi:AcrR family transcriptional regulator
MGRPREHDNTTRLALLHAAEKLIEADGPDAASVRAVADIVGTTTRAVYSVFGSKDGLLGALATQLFEMLSAALDECVLSDSPIDDVVTMSLFGFRRTAIEHPALYGLVFLRIVPELDLGPEFDLAAGAAFGRLEAQLKRLGSQGGLGAMNSRSAAQAVHGLTEGLASMELRGMFATPRDAERVWRQSVRALVEGFANSTTPDVRRSVGTRRSR